MSQQISNARIEVIQADITTLDVDAIVNAANAGLSGGGGVDGAIHRAAGPELIAACRVVGPCAVGSAKLTEGFGLPAKFVIHAVGPVWYGGHKGEEALLASCHRVAMDLAARAGARTIAFPAISCGAYRFPIDRAAHIAVAEVAAALERSELPERVTFACFDVKTRRFFDKALQTHGRGQDV